MAYWLKCRAIYTVTCIFLRLILIGSSYCPHLLQLVSIIIKPEVSLDDTTAHSGTQV